MQLPQHTYRYLPVDFGFDLLYISRAVWIEMECLRFYQKIILIRIILQFFIDLYISILDLNLKIYAKFSKEIVNNYTYTYLMADLQVPEF